VGTDGLRLCLTDGHVEVHAIGWGLAHLAPELTMEATYDVVFRLEQDEWNGYTRLQAKILELRS
jgi:hypothetical protein